MVKHLKIPSLPITSYKSRILKLVLSKKLRTSQVLIIQGETGCGKTTQVAQFILEANQNLTHNKMIAVTQPRRVAAISVARRVAEEVKMKRKIRMKMNQNEGMDIIDPESQAMSNSTDGEIGGVVGYSVRFDSKVTKKTKIKYMTDGMLVREALLDPSFSSYSFIIVDEAHERSINTDTLLGLLKMQLAVNYRLKVVIMSASLEAARFAQYFATPNILNVKGRLFPVEMFFTQTAERDHIDAMIISILQIHMEEGPGDILAFLTGQEEIEDVREILMKKREILPDNVLDFTILTLFSAIPSYLQIQIFEPLPPSTRKIILSTNIAETSLTIPNIKYVIDSGLVKIRTYDPQTGVELLDIIRESKSSALQRAGRAGRDSAGKCFRLLTEKEYEGLPEFMPPEVTRSNLANVALQVCLIGHKFREFPFMDRPSSVNVEKAIAELKVLGALAHDETLTGLGRRMAELPLPPLLSRLLLMSMETQFQCTKDMVTLIALLSVENLCYYNRKRSSAKMSFRRGEGDHLTLITIYEEWRRKDSRNWCKTHALNRNSLLQARSIRKQLKGYLRKYVPVYGKTSPEIFISCLTKASFINSAKLSLDGSHYRTFIREEIVYIHPTSVLFGIKQKPSWIVYSEIVATTKKYVREVSEADSNFCESMRR